MSEYLAFWSERVILIEIVVVKVLYKKTFLPFPYFVRKIIAHGNFTLV